MGKDESVVYTVMYPAFLNEQARNLIWKQPIPVENMYVNRYLSPLLASYTHPLLFA